MAVREYIGARYIPIFDGIWNNTKAYEPLTVVQYAGNSYTSRQFVPIGIEITNEEYWVETGNYNAQIEAYRQEVLAYNTRIQNNTDAIEVINTESLPAIEDDVEDIKEQLENIKRAPLEGKKIVIYGDSTFVESSYGTSVLCDLVAAATGATVINRCTGGTRLNTADTGLIAKLQNATAADFAGVDYCFFAYCTNDWQDGTPISKLNGDFSFENYLEEAYSLFKDLTTTTIPVWITPAGGYRSFEANGFTVYQRNICGNTLEDYVNCAIDFCSKHNMGVIDLYHSMGVNDANIASLFTISSNTIYVHYNQNLKLKIAAAFDKFYPFQAPSSPYNFGTSKLKVGSQLAYTETGNNSQNNVLQGASPAMAKATASILATSTGKTLKCTLTGDDTLIFAHKSGSDSVLVYVNNVLYAIVTRNIITAIRIKDIVSGPDGATIKFASSTNTTQYVCAPQLLPGYNKCASFYGTQNFELRTAPSSWIKVAHSAGEVYYTEGVDFIHLHIRSLTISEAAGATTDIIEIPYGPSFAASNVIFGIVYTSGTGWTPTAFQTIRSGTNVILRPMVSLNSGSIIHIDLVIPMLVGMETTRTW